MPVPPTFWVAGLTRLPRFWTWGTHFGSFLHRLALFGYSNVYGIDIDAYSISIGREVYPRLASRIQVYDGKSIPYPNASFDVITMFAVRTLMNEAAQYQHLDPDRLSFTHSLRVIRRKLAAIGFSAAILSRDLERESSIRSQKAGEIANLLQDALKRTRDLARGLSPVDRRRRSGVRVEGTGLEHFKALGNLVLLRLRWTGRDPRQCASRPFLSNRPRGFK